MLRAALRLLGFALMTSVFYGISSALLGYAAIYALNLYAPYPKRNEWAMHTVALSYFVPGVFFLSALALCMAWGATKSTSPRTLSAVALASGFAIALLETFEALPRNYAPWLGLLLPVFVVVATFVPLKILAARRREPAAMSNQRLERP